MRILKLTFALGCLLFFTLLQHGESLLMLSSMMLAAKTGLMMGKLGVGGMMMMLLAAQQQNYDGGGTATKYGKKRSVRSLNEKNDTNTSEFNKTAEILLTERMVRQIDATFDTFTCIPKFVCGMNAEPPSKKTSILNDYGHLLKLMISREESDDEDSEEEKEKGKVASPKSKKDLTESLKKDDDLEDMVNEELIDDDPSLLPFVLKEMKKKHDLQNDEAEMMSPGRPYLSRPRPASPLSSFSSFFPKVEAGLGTRVKDSDFDSDPFFEGFRSLKSIFANMSKGGEHEMLPILDMNETETGSVTLTKRARIGFIRRMAKELERSDDSITKYRIAAEVGKKLKSKEDCSKVFKKCPYKWEEVTGVVSNLRNSIVNHPAVTGKPAPKPSGSDKVVFVKTYATPNNDQSLMSFATTSTNEKSPTTVIHDLGNGNLMEISMKLIPMTDVPAKPEEEDLEVKLKPGEKRPLPSPEMIWSSNTFTPQLLSEEEVDASALSFQKTNGNGSIVRKKYTKPGHYPILRESPPTMPELIGEDDEIEDAYPVVVISDKRKNKLKKNKAPFTPKKKETNDEREGEDGDDNYEEDDEEDEEDDDNERERKARVSLQHQHHSGVLRYRAPSLLRRMPPFPLVRERHGQYTIFRSRDDLPRDEKNTNKTDVLERETSSTSNTQELVVPLT